MPLYGSVLIFRQDKIKWSFYTQITLIISDSDVDVYPSLSCS